MTTKNHYFHNSSHPSARSITPVALNIEKLFPANISASKDDIQLGYRRLVQSSLPCTALL